MRAVGCFDFVLTFHFILDFLSFFLTEKKTRLGGVNIPHPLDKGLV